MAGYDRDAVGRAKADGEEGRAKDDAKRADGANVSAAGGAGRANARPVLGEKRDVEKRSAKGLEINDILLIAILLAAGAVLKMTVGSLINFGMKPNFIIAMYCLIILLIRPRFRDALIIGLLAGVVCQLMPGQPYLNLVSEPIGAIAMCLLMKIPMKFGLSALKINFGALISTFISTLASGFAFVGIMYATYYLGFDIKPTVLAIFLGIIFGTATINAIIVQLMYIPLKLALKK